jgi:hypothetical protein
MPQYVFIAGTIETLPCSFCIYLQRLYFHTYVIISRLSLLAFCIINDTRWGSDVIDYFISRQTAHCVHCSVQYRDCVGPELVILFQLMQVSVWTLRSSLLNCCSRSRAFGRD